MANGLAVWGWGPGSITLDYVCNNFVNALKHAVYLLDPQAAAFLQGMQRLAAVLGLPSVFLTESYPVPVLQDLRDPGIIVIRKQCGAFSLCAIVIKRRLLVVSSNPTGLSDIDTGNRSS